MSLNQTKLNNHIYFLCIFFSNASMFCLTAYVCKWTVCFFNSLKRVVKIIFKIWNLSQKVNKINFTFGYYEKKEECIKSSYSTETRKREKRRE